MAGSAERPARLCVSRPFADMTLDEDMFEPGDVRWSHLEIACDASRAPYAPVYRLVEITTEREHANIVSRWNYGDPWSDARHAVCLTLELLDEASP